MISCLCNRWLTFIQKFFSPLLLAVSLCFHLRKCCFLPARRRTEPNGEQFRGNWNFLVGFLFFFSFFSRCLVTGVSFHLGLVSIALVDFATTRYYLPRFGSKWISQMRITQQLMVCVFFRLRKFGNARKKSTSDFQDKYFSRTSYLAGILGWLRQFPIYTQSFSQTAYEFCPKAVLEVPPSAYLPT